MSIAKNVHFKGMDEVLLAYKHQGVPAFAVFSHAQLIYKCIPADMDDGEAQLQEWLEMMGKTNWEHLTLRVYEDTSRGIKAKTDYDGSFNFQLCDKPSDQATGGSNLILSKLTAIEKRLEQVEEDDDEEDDGYGLGKLGRVLEHPAILPLVPVLTDKIMDLILGENKAGQTSRIAGITAANTIDDDKAIDAAIKRLKKTTPNLAAVLTSLAAFSENSPVKYNLYMATFLKMNH